MQHGNGSFSVKEMQRLRCAVFFPDLILNKRKSLISLLLDVFTITVPNDSAHCRKASKTHIGINKSSYRLIVAYFNSYFCF